MDNILIMTWSIKVNKNMPFHRHIPLEERLKQYIDTIIFYITKSNFWEIVYCDWNWFDIKQLSFLKDLAYIYGKTLELISFDNDQNLVVEKWKWYGENKIIEYVTDNSELIKNHKCFYKITGRYIVKNINNIIKNEEKKENIFFLSPFRKPSLATSFFKCNKNLFKKQLYGLWEYVNDKEWYYLENIYYRTLKEYKDKWDWKIECFKELPEFTGFMWSWVKLDTNILLKPVKYFLNKIHMFSL